MHSGEMVKKREQKEGGVSKRGKKTGKKDLYNMFNFRKEDVHLPYRPPVYLDCTGFGILLWYVNIKYQHNLLTDFFYSFIATSH